MFRSVMRNELSDYFGIPEEKIKEYVEEELRFNTDSNSFSSIVALIRHDYFCAASAEDFLQKIDKQYGIEALVNIDENVKDLVAINEELNDEELLMQYLVACNRGGAVSGDMLFQLGLRSLLDLKSQLKKHAYCFETRKYAGEVMLMANVLFEIRKLLKCLNNCKNSELDAADVGSIFRRPQQCSAKDIYGLAREQISYSFYFGQPVIPQLAFSIRQAIEVRIKESLGIALEVHNKDSNRVAVSRLLSFCEECKKKNVLRFPVSLKLLIEINKWSNCYVHSGYVHFPYFIIERILSKLEPLFFPGSEGINTPEGKMIMPFGPTVEVKKDFLEQKLHKNLRNYFKKDGEKMVLCTPNVAIF